MRILTILASLGCLGYGVWWVGTNHPEVKSKVEDFIDGGYFHTLEVRWNADQIMETHRKSLLKTAQHKFLEPQLSFYPYLLIEVKYSLSEDKTSEGVILWDMTDGEMVIDTVRWIKTHGFGDCIDANTDRHEFKILHLLSKRGGSLDRDGLSKALHVDNDVLNTWIESCRRKKLIVQVGNKYRLHLEHPRLKTSPQTQIDERLVTKPHRNANRVARRYSVGQVEKIAKAAFGNDFTIRNTTDVYLPVHSIVVQNPDGSMHTSHWNALNGKQLNGTVFID